MNNNTGARGNALVRQNAMRNDDIDVEEAIERINRVLAVPAGPPRATARIARAPAVGIHPWTQAAPRRRQSRLGRLVLKIWAKGRS